MHIINVLLLLNRGMKMIYFLHKCKYKSSNKGEEAMFDFLLNLVESFLPESIFVSSSVKFSGSVVSDSL